MLKAFHRGREKQVVCLQFLPSSMEGSMLQRRNILPPFPKKGKNGVNEFASFDLLDQAFPYGEKKSLSKNSCRVISQITGEVSTSSVSQCESPP